MRAFFCFVFAAILSAASAAEKPPDFSTLYDRATLDHWQASFGEDITAMYKEDIVPLLTTRELEKLRDVRIEFPLVGQNKGVFDFYAGGRTVTLPVVSLRFFGDLALAYGWLEAQGYNVGTVQQYVGMIHYRPLAAFEGGRYPRPLDALGIPANARENPRAADALTKLITTNFFFILGHELGHIYYGHAGYDGIAARDARANEAQADAFAVELMRRKRLIPWGPLFWFSNAALIEAHRVDFSRTEDWERHLLGRTHPLSADRIEALANRFETAAPDFAKSQPDPVRGLQQIRGMIGDFRKVASVLSEEGPHLALRRQSQTTEPRMLAPRRGVAYEAGTVASSQEGEPFSGSYDCTITGNSNGAKVDARIAFRREGANVAGEYTYGAVTGKIRGEVRAFTLLASWTEGTIAGKLVLTAEPNGNSFSGTWGVGTSRTDGGKWSGKRR